MLSLITIPTLAVAVTAVVFVLEEGWQPVATDLSFLVKCRPYFISQNEEKHLTTVSSS